MRIVYVEDNIANVHLVKRVARMGHHEVINYIDGMDALNNFDSDEPDLVLMDIQLAGELTGIEVVRKLREQGHTAPIFAVTAYAMVGDRERCLEAGCTGYMSKPIPIPELVRLFQEYDQPEPEPESQSKVASTDTPSADTKAKSADTTSDEQPEAPETSETAASTPPAEASIPVSDTASTAPADTNTQDPAPKTESTEMPPAPSVSPDPSKTETVAKHTECLEKDTSPVETKPPRSPLIKETKEGKDKLSSEDSEVMDKVEGENSTPKRENNDKHAEMK